MLGDAHHPSMTTCRGSCGLRVHLAINKHHYSKHHASEIYHQLCLISSLLKNISGGHHTMSTLRRRFLGDSFSEPSRDPFPAKGEPATLVSTAQLQRLKEKSGKKSKRYQWFLFALGGLFGVVGAVFFANQQDVINLEGLVDFNLESLVDVIPAGIVKDVRDLTV